MRKGFVGGVIAGSSSTLKYHNKPVIIDGIRFQSTKEGNRYSQLKILERTGEIKNLQLQPRFLLTVNDIKIGTWIADFSYFDMRKGEAVIEDTKGYRQDLYKWKKKHFEAQYGRKILET